MVNEENVKHFLTSWIKLFDAEVFWEKKNKWNYPIFQKEGRTKPDLIIRKNGISFAVEVKDANGGDGNIDDSFKKIVKYANEDNLYFINNKEQVICGYLVATQNSLKGHLYNNENVDAPTEGRIWSIAHGETPSTEYRQTKNFVRLLWRDAADIELKEAIGVLLSNALNISLSINPLLFYKHGKQQQFEVWT